MALLRKDLGACQAKLADLERRHAAAQQAAGAAQARYFSSALTLGPGGPVQQQPLAVYMLLYLLCVCGPPAPRRPTVARQSSVQACWLRW